MPAWVMSRIAVSAASSIISSRSKGPQRPSSQALTPSNHQPALPCDPTTVVGKIGSLSTNVLRPLVKASIPAADRYNRLVRPWLLADCWRLIMTTAEPQVIHGLEGVLAFESSIAYIDGPNGVLSFRGYDIHDFAERASFEDTVFLVWNGR